MITTNVVIIITMFKTKEFKYVKDLAIKYLKKFKNKLHGFKA